MSDPTPPHQHSAGDLRAHERLGKIEEHLESGADCMRRIELGVGEIKAEVRHHGHRIQTLEDHRIERDREARAHGRALWLAILGAALGLAVSLVLLLGPKSDPPVIQVQIDKQALQGAQP